MVIVAVVVAVIVVVTEVVTVAITTDYCSHSGNRCISSGGDG